MFGPVIIFYVNILEKEYFVTIFPLFLGTNFTKIEIKVPKHCHNCLQHERVLQIFHFHIFSIKQIGKIYLLIIVT